METTDNGWDSLPKIDQEMLLACSLASPKKLKRALKLGAKHSPETNPFSCAAASRSIECIEILLAAGFDPNIETAKGFSPLQCAASAGSVTCLEALIGCGIPLDLASPDTGDTALILAVWVGSFECVKILLSHGADPLLINFQGKSALDIAIQNKSSSKVALLLPHYESAKAKKNLDLLLPKSSESSRSAIRI